jgi:hypothetical protein
MAPPPLLDAAMMAVLMAVVSEVEASATVP